MSPLDEVEPLLAVESPWSRVLSHSAVTSVLREVPGGDFQPKK